MRRVFQAVLPDGETTKVVRVDDLRLPIHIALGSYEGATQEELNDHISDLRAELARREPRDDGSA